MEQLDPVRLDLGDPAVEQIAALLGEDVREGTDAVVVNGQLRAAFPQRLEEDALVLVETVRAGHQ
ncbi:hypothetical protein ABZX62_06135 [Streptomyces flavidovirens]|uniref:Thiamine biosynthesis protein ThiS n=1 Tax=Streptomyces flavidovirens TaxID=67298 RepID=A0ABW6RF35_9ACTN